MLPVILEWVEIFILKIHFINMKDHNINHTSRKDGQATYKNVIKADQEPNLIKGQISTRSFVKKVVSKGRESNGAELIIQLHIPLLSTMQGKKTHGDRLVIELQTQMHT